MPTPSQYSLICSTPQLHFYSSYPTHLFICITLSIRDIPTKLLKHFISRTFTFLLSALLIPHASAPYNAVGTITPSYTLLGFNPQSSIAQDTFHRSPSSIPLIHSVYHNPFLSSICCHLLCTPFKKFPPNPYTLSICHIPNP